MTLSVRRALVVLSAFALLLAAPAGASLRDEQALANRYAPVVRLVEQAEECGPGEAYRPLDVDALFGADTVALRGPWSRTDLVAIGPSARELAGGLYGYHLDFPGNALDPGCEYERWARALAAGTQPTVYAHVATERGRPGKLALQYWLFYAFNDYNNKHEGDWEMIQLVFDAASPAEALSRAPVEVGYSQHEGAERSSWTDEKLEIVDGTHPVVHPAAGSHANYFTDALYLGRSAEQGVGCDDTTSPTVDVPLRVQTIPADPAAARDAFPWIGFQGHWGEQQKAFYNGPTGPNLKRQWTQPISWAEDSWHDRAFAVPAGGLLGTDTTDFFCGGVAAGSDVLRRLADNPGPILFLLLLLVSLLVLGIVRATWRPSAPLRVARRRSWGQTLSAAGRMYAGRFPLWVAIGLVLIPITIVVSVLQSVIVHASKIGGIDVEGEGGGVLLSVVVGVGVVLTLLGLAVVQAATLRALVEIDAGRAITPTRAFRMATEGIRSYSLALAVAVGVVGLLSLSVLLLPVAVFLVVRWALLVATVEVEGLGPIGALRRSGALVRRRWLGVASLVIGTTVLALVAGPLLGTALLLVTSLPFEVVNVVAGVTYAITLPFVALVTGYVYFDARVREELAAERPPSNDVLPAELSAPL